MVRAAVLAKPLVEGLSDAVVPPRNEKVVGSIRQTPPQPMGHSFRFLAPTVSEVPCLIDVDRLLSGRRGVGDPNPAASFVWPRSPVPVGQVGDPPQDAGSPEGRSPKANRKAVASSGTADGTFSADRSGS